MLTAVTRDIAFCGRSWRYLCVRCASCVVIGYHHHRGTIRIHAATYSKLWTTIVRCCCPYYDGHMAHERYSTSFTIADTTYRVLSRNKGGGSIWQFENTPQMRINNMAEMITTVEYIYIYFHYFSSLFQIQWTPWNELFFLDSRYVLDKAYLPRNWTRLDFFSFTPRSLPEIKNSRNCIELSAKKVM